MGSENVLNLAKVWFRFVKMSSNGKILKFRWEQLSEHRFEEFIDFKMNYYVPHEFSHTLAGIHINPEAMKEYRQILLKKYKHSSFHTSICCLEDNASDIVGFDSVRLIKQGEFYKDDVQAQTDEVKKFYSFDQKCDELVSVQDVMVKYGSRSLFEDGGCAIHPDYRGYQITHTLSKTREAVCKTNGVPLTGAWLTSIATQKATKHDGWDVLYEVNNATIEKMAGYQIKNAPATMQYKVKRYDLKQALTLSN